MSTGQQLPFSRESDLAANREARFSPRQMAGLAYSGLWRLLVGLPTVAVAPVVGWHHDFWVMLIGMALFAVGLYVSWRGFGFLGDVITRNVAFVTGDITRYSATYKGWTTYFVMVGLVQRRIRKKTYKNLPENLDCTAYYAAGSQHLLSIEPALATEPHPDLHFGGDTAHAWDRIRWPLVFAAVGVFGLAIGTHGVVTSHPATTYMVSGIISDYHEHSGKAAYRHLFLADSSTTYSLDYLDSYSPPIPYLGDYEGSQVDLYVNRDTSGDVVALRMRERLYAGDYYLSPGDQTRDMMISGALIGVLSAATLAWALGWHPRARKSVHKRVRSYAASRSKVTSIKGL